MAITLAKFLDVAEGTQPNQFSVGSRSEINSFDDLDPIYKRLIDEPSPHPSRCWDRTDGPT